MSSWSSNKRWRLISLGGCGGVELLPPGRRQKLPKISRLHRVEVSSVRRLCALEKVRRHLARVSPPVALLEADHLAWPGALPCRPAPPPAAHFESLAHQAPLVAGIELDALAADLERLALRPVIGIAGALQLAAAQLILPLQRLSEAGLRPAALLVVGARL
eukprot:3842012-Prymnesium_polylepis.1